MFYSTTLLCYCRLLRPTAVPWYQLVPASTVGTAVPQCGTYGTLYKLVQAGSSC